MSSISASLTRRDVVAHRPQGMKFKRVFTSLPLVGIFLLMAACSLPANEGLVPMNGHPQPYAQAHATCWEKSMGSNYAGGNAQFGGEMTLYGNCMAQAGWAASEHMF